MRIMIGRPFGFLTRAAGFSGIAPALVALSLVGCAEERAPISRVQPNALAKSFFVGTDLEGTEDDPEFYKRGTVIDVGYGAGQDGLFTATYAQPVSRIRWEITEKTLNARLSFERVVGTDGNGESLEGVEFKATNDGQIVASYAIESHFDIRREYNPQTGEELNVVVENTQDRPWYARKYFRIDWAQNLVTDSYDYDTLSMLGVLGGIDYDPIAYTVLDPDDPDAPHFVPDEGYFDVTNKVYATPKTVDISSLGVGFDELPACLLSSNFSGGTDPWGNCNPIEITLRESYRRITDTDYEPMDHDGVRFRAIGAFNFNYRRGYDRHYGMLDSEWNRFISRYNIWQRSHYYEDPESMTGAIACATEATTEAPTGDPTADPNRDDNGDGTADECDGAGSGSRCDVYKQKCTLPYRERSVATQPWYIAGDRSMFDPTNWAVEEWDLALKTAVQTARLVECRRTGGADCEAAYPMWTGQQEDNDEAVRIAHDVQVCQRSVGWDAEQCADYARDAARELARARGNENDPATLAIGEVVTLPSVIVLCNNPVEDSDHPACGRRGLAPRPGDIRYHIVQNVEAPQVPSPWGILADGDDPVTGEKVAGWMNIWTHITDIAAQGLVDLVRYTNGELSTEEITNGKYVRDWAGAARLGANGAFPTLSKAELDARVAAATHTDREIVGRINERELPGELKNVLHAAKARVLDVEARSDVASPSLARVQTTLAAARGTAVESALLNPAMFALAGVPGGAALGGTAKDVASPLALNNPLVRTRLHELRENALAKRGACVLDEAPEPTSMTGLADILKYKFPPIDGETASERHDRYERMLTYVKRRFHYAVIAHEMGHSVGLRHNFVSSSAPLFYRPQYWQLRTKNGSVTTPCTEAVEDGSTCVGPRYWDPVTEEEQSQLINMWMQSTVMDYPGDLSQDMLGLGITDFAAARFFYGDTVSVYAEPSHASGTRVGTGITLATDTFGGLLGIRYGIKGSAGQGADDFHYSALQQNYGMVRGCYDAEAVPPRDWSDAVDGYFDPVLDGHVVGIDGRQTKCRQTPVDYLGFTELRQPTDAELNGGYYRGGPSVHDATGRTRVPYAFASDNWADLGNVSVLRHDNGADPYEQVQFLVTTKEVRHILDNYRRNRSTFSVRGAADRSFARYNMKLQGIAGGMGFFASIYNDIGLGAGYDFEMLWPYVVNLTARDNMIASTVAFDHFTRELSRPQPGEHYRRPETFADPVFRSASDPDDLFQADAQAVALMIPNGATGYLRDVGFGGHLLENAMSSSNGDFDVEFTENAGSYYDKINTALLLAESEDRFVSQSRRDFYDARFRAVGLADVFPDGFRRTVANALTGDRSLLAPRIETDETGLPLLDSAADVERDPFAALYPARPLGWVSLWPAKAPEVCFSRLGRAACTDFSRTKGFAPDVPANTAAIDPQIGWEVQKFFVAWTIALIKANEKTPWLDQMRLYRLGPNATPEFEDRIEWQDPSSGELYYAKTFGTECLFGDAADACAGGSVVQKGIAARVLEYANALTEKAYQLDETNYPGSDTVRPGFNELGRAMVARHPSGEAIVKSDPAVRRITGLGMLQVLPPCDQNVDPECTPLTVDQNHFAFELESYRSVPEFLWQAGTVYGLFGEPRERGIF
jgi:hypothetical protein